jgi:hypothetical protein
MIAGMLPVALLGRAGFQAQMAVAVIGGLVTSTGLTLVIVPATFTWIDDLERWVGRKFGHRWINGATAAAPETEFPVPAPAAAPPPAQAASGRARDLPGDPLPDAAR